MENKKWIVAVVAGLAAAGLHFKYIRDLEAETTGGERVAVLLAAKDVKEGERLKKEHLASRTVPRAYVDDRAVRASKLEEVLDMATAVALVSGQTLMWTDFQVRKRPEDDDLAALLEPGQRAVTIRVDAALSMGGLLRPGHRVDILCTFGKGLGAEKRTATLLQNVTVLAVGRTVGAGEDEPEVRSSFKTVTLATPLEDAERLALATKQGVLSLALRGRQDLTETEGVPAITADDLLRVDAPEKKPRAESIRTIERIQRR